jgi:hypothetical protein
LFRYRLFPSRSGAFALLSGFFSLPLNAGLLEKLAAAQLGQDTFLLNAFVESPE